MAGGLPLPCCWRLRPARPARQPHAPRRCAGSSWRTACLRTACLRHAVARGRDSCDGFARRRGAGLLCGRSPLRWPAPSTMGDGGGGGGIVAYSGEDGGVVAAASSAGPKCSATIGHTSTVPTYTTVCKGCFPVISCWSSLLEHVFTEASRKAGAFNGKKGVKFQLEPATKLRNPEGRARICSKEEKAWYEPYARRSTGDTTCMSPTLGARRATQQVLRSTDVLAPAPTPRRSYSSTLERKTSAQMQRSSPAAEEQT